MHDKYQAVTDPPLSPPDTTRASLRPLADALNAVGRPVADTLDQVTADMVELAFNSLSPRERQRLLGTLGIKLAAPRRAGKALCRDVLSRMQRDARQRQCRCATRALTGRVMNDVATAAWPADHTDPVADPVTRWGEFLVRLAIFSWCQASAGDARILLWAADRDWLGLGSGDPLLNAVRGAAADVVAATPGFEPPGPESEKRSTPMPAPRTSDAPSADFLPTVVADNPSASVGDSGSDDVLDPDAAHQALELAFHAALDAAQRIGAALDDGCPPDDDDLLPLAALRVAFLRMRGALSEVGIKDVPDRLQDLSAAVRSHRAERRQDHAARETLGTLLTVTCAAESSAAQGLEAARELACQLLDLPVWSGTERGQADALGLLVEIVRLREKPDALPEIMTRLQYVGAALPPAVAVAAMLYKELSLPLPHGTEDPSDQPVAAEPSPAATQPETLPTGDPSAEPLPDTEIPPSVPTAVAAPPSTPAMASTTLIEPLADKGESDAPDAPPLVLAGEPESTDIDTLVSTAVSRLVTEGRFGLAYHLAGVAGRPEHEAAALRLAAAGAALGSGSGPGARTFDEALRHCDSFEATVFEDTVLLVLPALVRAALATGEYSAGAQLKALASRLPEGLAAVAVAVADPALSGALAITRPLAVTSNVSEAESRLREVLQQARDLLKPPRLRFNRATHIAKRWLAADGLLGSVLHAIVNGTADTEPKAADAVARLTRLTEIHSEIDRMDRELRASSGRALQGSGRQDLVHLVERAMDCAKSWLDVTAALRRSSSSETDWARQEIVAMRQTVLTERARVLDDLDSVRLRSVGSLPAAAAWAAHASLSTLMDEIEHGATGPQRIPGGDAKLAIDAELLKIPLADGEQPSVQELLAALDRTWEEALALHEKQDAFSTAHRILDLAEQDALPSGEPVDFAAARRSQLHEAETKRRAELRTRHAELLAELRRAQADGALTDDQDLSLQELLADAHPESEDGSRRELVLVSRTLNHVAELLPRYRRQAADRLRSRLMALPEVSEEDRSQVLRHLDTDGLATAADLVYFLELGEPVPEIVSGESHLSGFFPAVPDALGNGISDELIDTVRGRSKHPALPVLDYTSLSEDEAERAADALADWRELSTTEPRKRQDANARYQLLPALKLLGYEAKRAHPLHDLPRSNEYRFVDVLDIEINGRAWAPAFGSKLEQAGRLRVLMIWGRPSAKLLLSRVAQEPSKESLLVAYFGTLSSQARAELAAASIGIAPLMIVDDAALAYLAAHGNRQVSVATETLLPFSGVNPYIKEKRGRIGREMFYGRDAERKNILDPDGTQIIFGGRGLGKSALLNDAGDRFAEQQPGYHQKLYINLDQSNIGKGTALGPEAIWSVLARELTDQEVLPKPRRRAENNPYDRVRSGIKQWLSDDSRRRLLILMDECDRFFEADVPHCTETRRLRGLCTETPGRMKVVFAGLHSVQRFTRLARNGPFSHLAQTPTVVGPLAPQFAADLLVDPMRALGFEFVDVDLVNRVLGYCSYQPFLLQMFGSRLVEVMQQRRARGEAGGPPYDISAADVEAVESDPSLRADITAAFKDTLTLDDRYDVIANVLARHARDNGLESRLTDAELRDECASWWPVGFGALDSEGFRAYLQEMVGLGVLAPNHDGRGWHLRGPNALRMIGTAQEVESRLLSAADECQLEETVVLEGRPELRDNRSAPLTVTQVDDLLGDHVNQTRVVFGTPATGISDVEDTLRSVTERVAGWNLPPIGRPSVFRQALIDGQPGERRVVVSDLASRATNDEACREALALARTLVPERSGVTRAVVLTLGISQLALWRELLTGAEEADTIAVFLRRHDQRSLRAWAQHTDIFTADRVTQLLQVTGGWPTLLDRAIRLHRECGNEDDALSRLKDDLRQKVLAGDLLENSGLTADSLVMTGYRAVSEEFGTEWADEEVLLTAIELAGLELPDAQWVLTCLEALQAFDRNGTELRLEPVLHECWSRC
ncbi:hypothetical protein ACFYST_34880 [Kitasatospora sp. NPDC004614]|uniref:hypothetical protein n=1 Tax=unclassified Kitasatospora TaxID=2633591 RepID=UPI00367390F2